MAYGLNNTGIARDGSAQRAAQAQLATKGPYRVIDNAAKRPDVSANEGLVIYQLDTNKMYVSDGTTWQDLWTAYSDGAASGLDADLLDGQHGAYYLDNANATGVLTAAKGGTGQGTYAIGDLLYASGVSALSRLADVATGNALISGGVGVAPSWGKIALGAGGHVSGTLPVANGGTGITTWAPSNPVNAPRRNGTFLTMSASTERYIKIDKLVISQCSYTFSSAATTAGTEIDVYCPNPGQPMATQMLCGFADYFDSAGVVATYKLEAVIEDSGGAVYRVRFRRADTTVATYLGVDPNPAASLVGDILRYTIFYWVV